MHDFKMLRREYSNSIQLSWAEKDAVIRHSLWSQDRDDGRLLAWLKDSPGDSVVVHIAGLWAKQEILEVDPDGPITVMQGPSVHEALGLPDEEVEYHLELPKSEAIDIVSARNDALDEHVLSAFQSYVEIVTPRFNGEPFVHLTVGKRAFPIKVPFKLSN